MTNNHNIAIKYVEKGWKLFPARWNGTHQPLIKWGNNASSDILQIEAWAKKWPLCYFCVALQQSILTVLDIDNKKGKSGSASLFDLEFEHGGLPETLTVATPSGGFHFIFVGISSVSTGKLGKGVDTPVMIPLPGSVIKGKGKYKILKDVACVPVPAWIQKGAGEIKEKKERNDNVSFELDSEDNIKLAIQYLEERAEPSLEGDAGDLNAFKVSCVVRDYGISKEQCLALMLDHWNENCDPTWSFGELNKKVNNAYRYAQEPIGSNTPEAEFESLAPEITLPDTQPIASPERMPVIYRDDVVGVPPLREWMVEGFLPAKEVTLFCGNGGLGKSKIAMQLGINVSSGMKTFLGFDISVRCPVLSVFAEDCKDELHRRVYATAKMPEYEFQDVPDQNYVMASRSGLQSYLGIQDGPLVKSTKFLSQLQWRLDDVRGKSDQILLILDPLRNIFAVNDNDPHAATACIHTLLGGLVKDHACTILLISHPSKASIKAKIFDSGSPAWMNAARAAVALDKHENENLKYHRWLHHVKSNYSELFDPKLLRWDTGGFILDTSSVVIDPVHDENVNRVLEAIQDQCNKKHPTPFGTHHMSIPCIYKAKIYTAARKGGVIQPDEVKKIISELTLDGIIREVRGYATPSKNGIWPVELITEGNK